MTNRVAEAPQRSCLGCRTGKDKQHLIRFVLAPGNEVLPDLDSKLPGRGAYTCIDRRCLEKAIELRSFKRSFKCDVTVMSTAHLTELISQQLLVKITGLIGLANKAGLITSGGSLVGDALKSRKKPGLVIVARDVSGAISDKIIAGAEAGKVKCKVVATKEILGDILGKAPRSAIAVAPGGFVGQLVKAIDRYRNFLGEV
jgi:predicted RNA-binding protein YlxR (DUF448 family)